MFHAGQTFAIRICLKIRLKQTAVPPHAVVGNHEDIKILTIEGIPRKE